MCRRIGECLTTALLTATLCILAMTHPASTASATTHFTVKVGAEILVDSGFAAVAGKRIGLITNQTGLVRGEHLADLLHKAPNTKLAAVFAPEHGFRGSDEAGAMVRDAVDSATGVPVFSLYGASKKPLANMLRDIDVLVFDIQDIGARFYTYISTMGLAMQSAAAASIPFIVLDRPNPLGGDYVSGFVRESQLTSFVGQYPIPIVHGMTVGELARMIKGERWLDGLEDLDLTVVAMEGWRRSMRWPDTGRSWVATSPNIPGFEAALVYPGMGIVGELYVNEGRGTPTPFSLFGGPYLDAPSMADELNRLGLPGIRFEATTYTPRAIQGVASRPRFANMAIAGIRLIVTDVGLFEPLEVGVQVLTALVAQGRSQGVRRMFPKLAMFHAIAGTKRLYAMLTSGRDAKSIIAAWQTEVEVFKTKRTQYLLY
jgi:uncharacterized protein YbbC (DUF1343 family)